MTSQIENPPAFPCDQAAYESGCNTTGMTLRDYMATAAAIAFINNKDFEDAKYSVVARHSYDFADEMLEARGK